MLKTLGRSVYLTQFEEQRASLSAFAAGGAPVFISLHISEEFDAAYCARVQEMCDFLSAQGWRILADVSEKTIRQFGCADLTALAKRLHLWGLRLDYGFSVEQMCALAQQLPVAVNASTTTPEVARQLAAGGGLSHAHRTADHIQALHAPISGALSAQAWRRLKNRPT